MIQPLFRPQFFIALVLVAASVLVGKDTVPPGPLNAELQGLVDRHRIAGAVALVADKDKVLDIEAVGWSSLKTQTPMKTDDLFWIASMSKSVTATILMMLVDEGKVSIDDAVEKYLPEFKGQMVMDEKDKAQLHPPRHPITIKEVLSHTSGLVLANEKSLKRTQVLKDDIAECAALPLRQEPGTKFEYNNIGINTAGRIIEVISGMPYAEFMQKRLFDPLGMKDTTFWPDAEQGRRLAHTARFTADKTGLEEIDFSKGITPAFIAKLSEGAVVPHELIEDFGHGKAIEYAKRYGEPAGGLFSTAEDLGRFCRMLLNGGVFEGRRFLSEHAIKQMGSIQTGDVMVNPQEGYGLGWFVKKATAEGPSIGSYGHRGARRTVMWIDPTNQLAMILLVERFDMTGDEQKDVYGSFMKAAIQRWGKGG